MPLDERQRAMLREMGVPVWAPLQREDTAVARVGPDASVVSTTVSTAAASATAESAARRPGDPFAAESVLRQDDPSRCAGSAAPPAGAEAPPRVGAAPGETQEASELDWPALRQAVAGCRACGLCESRRQTVFGVGHPQAHWMVVGEAPGEQEDLRGEPFVGPAGRLLDQMLRAIGVTRRESAAEGEPALSPSQQAYIANTLKCRPPGNRNPDPAELARCEPFLVRQIQLVQPRLILAMGRFAVQALLRTQEPIGRLRGRVHRYQGVPLIVTYHPAYLLRNLPDKAKAWDDLCLAMQTMENAPGG